MTEDALESLSPDCVAKPIRADMDLLKAVMCWPGDAAAQQKFLKEATILEAVERRHLLPRDQLEQLVPIVHEATPPAQMIELLAAEMPARFAAAELLLQAIGGQRLGRNDCSFVKISGRIKEALMGKKISLEKKIRLEATTIRKEKVWGRFRPVSHLLAAEKLLIEIYNEPGILSGNAARLGVLLGLAGTIRRQAEDLGVVERGVLIPIPERGQPVIDLEFESKEEEKSLPPPKGSDKAQSM